MPETTTIPETISLSALPALRQPLADGIYAGVITMPDGANVVVVWLNHAKPPKRQGVDPQRAWAKSIGAQLITCAIGSLIVSTLGSLLPQTWVWTEDDYAPDPSAFAWFCSLYLGNISYDDRGAAGGAVAVRLIPLVP